MMKISNELEFAWKNAFAPTPRNVELFLRSTRRILLFIGGGTFIASKALLDPDYDWIMFWLGVVQVALEEMAVYLGAASQPGTITKTEVSYPQEVSDQVTVTTKTVASTDIKDEETE